MRPGESEKAYRAFRSYCDLDPASRSLVKVSLDLGKGYKNICEWSAKWQWPVRARYWDAHVAQIKQAAEDKVKADNAEKWAKRREEANERNWQNARLAESKGLAMLAGPLWDEKVEETDDEGNPVQVTRKAVKWDMKTAAALLKLTAELQAAALSDAIGVEDDGFDPETADLEQCRAYLVERGVLKALPAPEKGE